MNQIVRCYAEGRPDAWEAICLDFDLSVQGESFEAVYRDLNTSIEMYVEYVNGLPEAERAAFARRRAPLAVRLRFFWYVLRDLFVGGDGSNKSRHEYTAPCPV